MHKHARGEGRGERKRGRGWRKEHTDKKTRGQGTTPLRTHGSNTQNTQKGPKKCCVVECWNARRIIISGSKQAAELA